jgi:hypothetical protein
VWADEFDPTTVFDQESLAEITSFFMSNVKGGINKGQISLASFSAWDDVKAMMDEGVMTEKLLKGAWLEAAKGVKDQETIDYDSFLRLNVRLDLIMDEMEVMQEGANKIDEAVEEEEEVSFVFY